MVSTTINLYNSSIIYQIGKKEETGPKFEDEKDERPIDAKFAKSLWLELCRDITTLEQKKVERKEESEIKATFFFHAAKAVGLTEQEVRNKVKAYISENQSHVLNSARKIAQETGMNLDTIASLDFATLISCKNPENHKQNLLQKLVNDQQSLKHLHLANYTLVGIIAEMFNLNVNLRDMYIHYDHSFTAGMGVEQVRIVAKQGNATKTLELIQGWGILNKGLLSSESQIYHFKPIALL